jgi:hypothetical protein
MRTRERSATVLALAVVSLLGWSLTLAHECPCPGKSGRTYDPSTEITFKGTVEEVEKVDCHGRCGTGTHLIVKRDAEQVEVHLGPSAFLAEKGFKFAKGNAISVTGSMVKCMGEEFLVAREVKRGDATLKLRDSKGIPEWAGRGRRGGGRGATRG